uniref:Uncharacterized protein n=1 Tax=Acrobeloides nanus TaxID=290746 RepID=A0A914E4E7_9BILA
MYRDINDPRDPWAWRNKWTGPIRNDYTEFWIVIPLSIGLLLLALIVILPLFIHQYCRQICPCQSLCMLFDRFLHVLHEMGREKDECATQRYFENPAFDQHHMSCEPKTSTRSTKEFRRPLSRSKSCPPRTSVPRIKL